MSYWRRATRNMFRCGVLLAAAWGAAGGCGSDPGVSDDPRARGPSDFSSPLPEGTGIGQAGNGGGPAPSIPSEHLSFIPPGELTRVAGATLLTLNEYRGLHVVDMSGARPELLSRVPMPGRPVALFLADTLAIAVIADAEVTTACAGCPPDGRMSGSRVYLTDVRDPRLPVTYPPIEVGGSLVGGRLRGKLLDLVSRGGDQPATQSTTSVPGTLIVSLDLSDPSAPRTVRQTPIPGPEWVDQLHFAGDAVYLALYGSRRWINGTCADSPPVGQPGTMLPEGCSRIVAVDLSTSGSPGVAASIEVRGRAAAGGLDHFGGVVRILMQVPPLTGKEAEALPPRVLSLRATVAAELAAIGDLALPRPLHETAPRFRFAAGRVFVATDDPTGPLVIVEAAADKPPVIAGRLPAGALVRDVSHVAGDRLLVVEQQIRAGQCPVPALSLYDVASSPPSLLARSPLSTETDGGITVLDGGLVALAIRDLNVVEGAVVARTAVQLFDLDAAAGSLTARGRTFLNGTTFTALRAAGPGKVAAISSERMDVLDVADRAAPRTAGTLDLARWVQDIRFAGGFAVTLVTDSHQGRSFLQLSPESTPDISRPLASVSLEGQMGRMFVHDRFVYLFWQASRRVGRHDPRLDVFEIADGTLRPRASRSLAGPASLPLGSENDGDGAAGQGLRQIAGTTFVATLSRVTNCNGGDGIAVGPGAMPGRAGTCAPAALPPVTELPAAPAIADLPSAAETRRQLDGACPGSGAHLMVIDLSNPDDPRVASLVQLPGTGELGMSVVQDRTLFVLQDEITESHPPGMPPTRSARHFVFELDLSDPAAPRLGPRVNVPGHFLGARTDTRTWFTASFMVGADGKPSGVGISALYHPSGAPRAYQERSLVLTGQVSLPVVDGSKLFTTVDGTLVALDLTSPVAPVELSRTPIPGGTPQMHRVVGQHAFVIVGGRAMRAFDVRDPARPRLLNRIVRAPRGAHPVRLAPGNRAVVPRAEWGLDVIDLL